MDTNAWTNGGMTVSGLVTVVLPMHAGALDIRCALESLAEQRYRPIEIVVVDDGSDDAGPAWVRAFRRAHPDLSVHVRSQSRAGTAEAANRGLERARGEFVAFMHQGDTWSPDKLAVLVARLQADPGAALVLGGLEEEREGRTRRLGPARRVDGLFDGPVPLSAILARRSALAAIGGFDARHGGAAGYDLACRLALVGTVLREERVLARCLRRVRSPLPVPAWLACGERLRATGHLGDAALRRARARLHARHGWAALLADEPDLARDSFEHAVAASPWRGSVWLGLACARLDRWLFATGLLKPAHDGSLSPARARGH